MKINTLLIAGFLLVSLLVAATKGQVKATDLEMPQEEKRLK